MYVNNEGRQNYNVVYSSNCIEKDRKDYDKKGSKTGIQINKNILNGERLN